MQQTGSPGSPALLVLLTTLAEQQILGSKVVKEQLVVVFL
jgi:hypothetical protein